MPKCPEITLNGSELDNFLNNKKKINELLDQIHGATDNMEYNLSLAMRSEFIYDKEIYCKNSKENLLKLNSLIKHINELTVE